MLQIFEYNAREFTSGCIAVLDRADNVAVTHNLQQPHTISFEYPADEKAGYIIENNIVVCEGQAYRLTDVTRECESDVVIKAQGERIFFADARRKHLPNVPDKMGVNPYTIIESVFNYDGSPFHLLTDDELKPLGMARIGSDNTRIDWFSVDKTNPYDVCMAVIEAYGRGEIYVDNYNFAVVMRIGKDNQVRLTLDKNMQSLTVQRQTTELVTRLYPYGENDMHIGSVNKGVKYIESSEGIEKYGVIEGYKDYSDCIASDKDAPQKLLEHAAWDLVGRDNPYRLDTPQITISGNVIDLAKLKDYGDFEKISLGDTVHVYDDSGTVYDKRIINITYYPYSSQLPSVTIGSPSNTNYFYTRWQQGKLLKTLMKNSTTTTEKIKASSVTGSSAKVTSMTASATNTESLNVSKSSTLNSLSAVKSDITELAVMILTVGNINVGEKLTDLQDQINELKGEQET